jgi:hypothetical protein
MSDAFEIEDASDVTEEDVHEFVRAWAKGLGGIVTPVGMIAGVEFEGIDHDKSWNVFFELLSQYPERKAKAIFLRLWNEAGKPAIGGVSA